MWAAILEDTAFAGCLVPSISIILLVCPHGEHGVMGETEKHLWFTSTAAFLRMPPKGEVSREDLSRS